MIYMTLEWRKDHAAVDIEHLLEPFAVAGWKLLFVLEHERVLILGREQPET